MSYVEFDKEELEKWLKRFTENYWVEVIEKYMTSPKTLLLLDSNNFEELYREFDSTGYISSILTAILLIAGVEFLPYLNYLPKYCFKELPIKKLIIPKNIKALKEYSCLTNTLYMIEYQGTTEEWYKISQELSLVFTTNLEYIKCTDNIIKL